MATGLSGYSERSSARSGYAVASPHFTVRSWTAALIFPVISAIVGVMLVFDWRLFVLPFVVVATGLILFRPTFRLAFITFGGIFTLQGDEGLSPVKLMYLAGCFVCIVLGVFRLLQRSEHPNRSLIAPILHWTWLWAGLIFVSLFVAVNRAIPLEDWLRGAIPYLLFACVPIVVYDVVRDSPAQSTYRALQWCFVGAGLLTAISWFVSWTNRRGYAEFNVERLFLWSFVLSLALFCYAISASFHARKNRLVWFLLAVVIFTLFALTGTRQTVLFLLAPVIVVLLGNGRSVRNVVRFGRNLVPASIVGIAAVVVLTQAVSFDLSAVQDRFSGWGELTNDGTEGRSYQERVLQTNLAREAFSSNVWTGVSPGYRYEWFTFYAGTKSSFTIDSPLALPANFGLLGVAVAVATFLALRRFVGSIPAGSSRLAASTEIDALKTFALILIVYFLAGSPFEDKGLAFAFMFILSLTIMKLLVDRPLDGVVEFEGRSR